MDGLSNWSYLGADVVQPRSQGAVLGKSVPTLLHKVLSALAVLTAKSHQRTDGRRCCEMSQELEY